MGSGCTTARKIDAHSGSIQTVEVSPANAEAANQNESPFSWVNAEGEYSSSTPKIGQECESQELDFPRKKSRKTSEYVLEDIENDTEKRKSAVALREATSRRRSSTHWKRAVINDLSEYRNMLGSLLKRNEGEGELDYIRRLFNHLKESDGKVLKQYLAATLSENGFDGDRILALGDRDKDSFTFEEFSTFFGHVYGNKRVSILAESDIDDDVVSFYNTSEGLTDEKMSPYFSYRSSGAAERIDSVSVVTRKLHDINVLPIGAEAERIKCVDISRSGTLYAVSHRDDCTVHIYSTQTGQELVSLRGHGDGLLSVKFSPDRKYIASASRDCLLVLWDRTVGLEYQFIEHPGMVTALAYSFDGKYLYSGCQDSVLRKLTSPKGDLVAEAEPHGLGDGVDFGVVVCIGTQHTKDELVLFSRSSEKVAYLVNSADLSEVGCFGGHQSLVWCAGFNALDSLFFTACETRINVWLTSSLNLMSTFDSFKLRPAPMNELYWTTVTFGPNLDDCVLFAFTTSRQLFLISLKEGGPIMDLTLKTDVYALSEPSNTGDLVFGDDFGNVYIIKVI